MFVQRLACSPSEDVASSLLGSSALIGSTGVILNFNFSVTFFRGAWDSRQMTGPRWVIIRQRGADLMVGVLLKVLGEKFVFQQEREVLTGNKKKIHLLSVKNVPFTL